MKLRSLLLFIVAASCPLSGRADVITLGADKDTSIFKNSVNNSLGGGPAFFAGTNTNNFIQRALISFNLSSVPVDATVTDVRLTLTLGQVASGGSGTATIGLFGLTQNWGEGTVGSGSAGIAGTGNGFAASAGDASWNAASFGSTLWTTAGGTHAATQSASLVLNGTTKGTAYTWLSTPQLVADVQGWLNTPGTNFGWELINANETTASSQYAFYSREWSDRAEDLSTSATNAEEEPALQVTYVVPEPGTSGLLAAAALWFARRRRSAQTGMYR